MQVEIPEAANDNAPPAETLTRFVVESNGYKTSVFASGMLSAAKHFKKKATAMGIATSSIAITRC